MSAYESQAWLQYYPEWTPHTLDYGDTTLLDIYDNNLKINADRPATYFFGRTQSYAELDRQVRAAAAGLKAFGVRPGDRVAIVAPNSPQWFNTGLHWAYGIDGPSQGHFYVDYRTGALVKSDSAYEHPQPHACFIQSVSDDLVNDGGIMDLWVREARLFKYGSGTGTNFSSLRAEG